MIIVCGLSKRLPLDIQESKTYPSGNVVLRHGRAASAA